MKCMRYHGMIIFTQITFLGSTYLYPALSETTAWREMRSGFHVFKDCSLFKKDELNLKFV